MIMNKYILIALANLFLLSSCSDFLEELPYGTVTPETFYKTESDAIMAGTSCYTQMTDPTSFWAAGLDAVGDIQSDDIMPYLGWTLLMNTHQFDGNHETVQGVWKAAYKGISRCNTCIDNVSPMEIRDEIKSEVLGQAHFIRDYWYFRLVRLYGGVPLITKEYTSLDDLYPPRASVQEVYDLIISDLEFAVKNLPVEWSDAESGRITQGAAMSYLSLVYLNLKEWDKAEQWAAKVMLLEDQGIYQLLEDFASIHLETNENNKESILELQYSTEHKKNWRPVYMSPRNVNMARDASYGWVQCSESIVNEYEPEDKRFTATFFSDGEKFTLGLNEFVYKAEMAAPGGTGHCIKKGNIYYGEPRIIGINTIIMRYAEVILFRAEALNEMGRTNEAIPLLKRIRDRAGLETNSTYSQDEMRKAIRHERRVEFAFEDIRGWDIIRWGIQEETLGKIPNSQWKKGKCELWPLPSFVLDENANITENNPGW